MAPTSNKEYVELVALGPQSTTIDMTQAPRIEMRPTTTDRILKVI